MLRIVIKTRIFKTSFVISGGTLLVILKNPMCCITEDWLKIKYLYLLLNISTRFQKWMTILQKYSLFCQNVDFEITQLMRRTLISGTSWGKNRKSQFLQKEIHKEKWFALFLKRDAQNEVPQWDSFTCEIGQDS